MQITTSSSTSVNPFRIVLRDTGLVVMSFYRPW